MCLIIDANQFCRFFNMSAEDAVVQAVWKWIMDQDGVIAIGGKLSQELMQKNPNKIKLLAELKRAGKVVEASQEKYQCALEKVKGFHLCSDDEHVLAVALATGARTLWSADQNLHNDFTNRTIINNERGSVFQYVPSHQHLLTHKKPCRHA